MASGKKSIFDDRAEKKKYMRLSVSEVLPNGKIL
jgi:hypothetical protein